MLERIETKNFKLIKEATLDLHPNVNIFSGASDGGKSTLLKSILLPILNKPSGYNYKPWNSKKGVVTSSDLKFDDCDVKRVRSSTVNKYVLDKDEENPLGAFGVNVPPQIEEKINIPDYCIHTQFDGFFLLDDTPGKVAKKINEVCDLSIIHESSSKIDSLVSKAKANLKYTKETLEEKELELAKLLYVDNLEVLSTTLEDLLNSKESIVSDLENLSKEADEIDKLKQSISLSNSLIDLEPEILKLSKEILEQEKISGNKNLLEKTIFEIEQTFSELKKVDNIIELGQEIIELKSIFEIEESRKSDLALLTDNINSILNSNEELEKINNVVLLEPQIQDIVENCLTLKELSESIDILNGFLQNTHELESSKSLKVIKLEDEISFLIDLINVRNKKSDDLKELSVLCKEVESSTEELKKAGQKMIESQVNYNLYLKSLDVCPTCGNNLKEERKDEV